MNVKALIGLLFAPLLIPLSAQTDPVVKMEEVTVDSPRVANHDPAGTFAMPVSALRFDPRADVQARNLAEGQADVSIRGGTFENTGFKLGAATLYDPQTGHYAAEIPVAPNLLSSPQVLTGVENAFSGLNSSVGTVAYAWRPITNSGQMSVSGGEYESNRQAIYQGYSQRIGQGDARFGADVALDRSESAGSVPYGDHRFYRYNGRLQLVTDAGQTDFMAGYQSKFFGWHNLYTPFGVNETEDLQTTLFTLNHRKNLDGGDYVQVGAFWRRNKDDYEFNRFIPGLYNPYQHTTWVTGVSAEGRSSFEQAGYALSYSASMMADSLKSTSLVYGRFRHRDYYKATLIPERSWKLDGSDDLIVKAGGSFDDTNKDSSAFSPVVEVSTLTKLAGKGVRRFYLSYAQSTQVATYTALNSSRTSGLFRGNPDLGRSRSHNVEFGTSMPLGEWKAGAAVFWRSDRDLVDWTYRLSSSAARTADVVDVDTTGFEAFLSRNWNWLNIVFGYTVLSKDATYKTPNVDASFYALNYPKQRFTAAFVAHLGGGFELRMDNEARIQQDNILRSGSSDALISALGISYRPPAMSSLTLNAQVDNLWNSTFQEVPAVPAGRRLLTFGATYAW
ncbi:MAG: TonB-dependent receptor [Opitutaceae bacterium]